MCDHLVDFQLIVKHETKRGSTKTVSYVKRITLYLFPSTQIRIEKLHIIRVSGTVAVFYCDLGGVGVIYHDIPAFSVSTHIICVS